MIRLVRIGTAAFVALAVVALVAIFAGGRVSAHAQLLEVTPANGETVDSPPAEVVLLFSEPVSLTGGSVRVLNDDAVDVATGTVLENDTITVALPADLANGTYTVASEVISADSHRITGASVFHVGAPSSSGLAGEALEGESGESGWGLRAGATMLSGVGYAAAMLAVGSLLFSRYADRTGGLEAMTMRAAVLGAVALAAALPFRIARVGGGLDALRDDDVLWTSLRGPIGVSTGVTVVSLLFLAALLDRGVAPWLTVALGGAALVGFALEGHTRSNRPRWAMIGSDAVHLIAGAVWFGGIVALVLAFRRGSGRCPEDPGLDADHLAGVVRRFSAVALFAVGAVSVTGVVMAWIILPTAGELVNTGYGLALITKVSLVVVVVGLGAFNRFRLLPAVQVRSASAASRQQTMARRWLARVVLAELTVLLAVVGVTAVLVTRSPIRSASAATPPLPTAPTRTFDIDLTQDAGTAQVSISPARTGANEVEVLLRDVEGRIINPVEAPVIEFTQVAADLGPLRPDVRPRAIGRYETTADLAIAGDWEITVRVRVSDFVSANGSTTVTIT